MSETEHNEQESNQATQELQKHVGTQIVAWLGILPPDDPMRRELAVAAFLCRNSFVPACCKDKPMECLFVIQRGRELGLSPTMALQQLWITKHGKLGMEAAAAKALLDSKGFGHSAFITSDHDAAVIVARPGIDIDPIIDQYLEKKELKNVGGKGWFISYWDLERVRKIKTWEGKKEITLDKKSTWQAHPGPLYRHRGLMDAGREAASDLLGGIYGMEEIAEIEANERATERATPVTVESLEATAGTGADGAEKIDQSIIRPEDETRLRQAFTKAGCTGEVITAALLTIQEEAKTAEEAVALIDKEIAKLKASVETHDPPQRRRSKPNPMKKAGESPKKPPKKPPEKPPTNGPDSGLWLSDEDVEEVLGGTDSDGEPAPAEAPAEAEKQEQVPDGSFSFE